MKLLSFVYIYLQQEGRSTYPSSTRMMNNPRICYVDEFDHRVVMQVAAVQKHEKVAARRHVDLNQWST